MARQLHRWNDCRSDKTGGRHNTSAVQLQLRACVGDQQAMWHLRQLLWSSADRDLCRLNDAAVVERVVEMLRTGTLCVCGGTAERNAVPRAAGPRTISTPASPPPPPRTSRPRPKEVKKKTWIQIELVGEDDKPISGVRYSVTLPDGSVRTGVLNAQGRARFDDIDSGQALISFPDLDRDAWESIS